MHFDHHRREFLTYSAGAALSLALQTKAGATPQDAPGEWRNRQSPMAYRRLGRTGYMISEMVMGGNTIAPDNHEHVLQALDAGLNYLDTAPAYGKGRSEEGYARVLKSRKRDSFFLNSKVSLWDTNRNLLYQQLYSNLAGRDQFDLRQAAMDDIAARGADKPDYFCNYFSAQRQELEDAALSNVMEKKYGRRIDRDRNYRKLILDSVDQSLARLGTDHLDLLMCPHGANSAYELLNYPEIFDAFESLKRAGKVRHFGVSAHTDPAGVLDAAIKTRQYSAAMVAYNIVNQTYLNQTLERAKQADVGVIAMKVARPVHNGRGGGQQDDPARVKLVQDAVPGPLKVPQKAYLWALRNPNLSAVISELINAGLVKDNLPLAAQKKPA
ncbi:MAG: aldo/keto reductase [Bryobacteraceae bacterium]